MPASALTSHLHGFVRASGMAHAQQINSHMRVLSKLLLPERIHIENRLHTSLAEFTRERIQKIFNALIRSGGLRDLTDDALRYYVAAWRPTDSATATRAKLKERLAQTKQDDKTILSVLERTAREADVTFDGVHRIFETAYTLWFESSVTALESLLHRDKYASAFLLKAISTAKAAAFTADDLARVDIITNTYPQLGRAIEQRTNQVTVKGFSNAMFDTMRDTIHTELYERMEGGLGARDLAKKLGEDLVDKYGKRLPSEAMTNAKQMLWARTEGCVVMNDGLLSLGQSAGMDGKQWFTVGDGLVRQAHSSNEAAGIIKMTDDFPDGSSDAGSGSTSPWNCVLPGAYIYNQAQIALRAWYSGPSIELKCAGGHRLRVTAQHPVLTAHGWIPAGELCNGDQVFCYSNVIQSSSDIQVQKDNNPSSIEKVFRTFSKSRKAVRIMCRVSGVDLYGDGYFIERNINVVWSNGLLWSNKSTKGTKGTQDSVFMRSNSAYATCSFERTGPFFSRGDTVGLPSSSFPRSRTLALDEFGISEDTLPLEFFSIAPTTDRNSVGLKTMPHVNTITTELVAQRLKTASCKIQLDEIVEVKRFTYTGHVYDLQTDSGLIIADHVIISNCRCTCAPALLKGSVGASGKVKPVEKPTAKPTAIKPEKKPLQARPFSSKTDATGSRAYREARKKYRDYSEENAKMSFRADKLDERLDARAIPPTKAERNQVALLHKEAERRMHLEEVWADYQNNDYTRVSRALRTGKVPREYDALVAGFNEMGATVPRGAIAFRGIDLKSAFQKGLKNAEDLVGTVVSDKAFTSMTMSYKTAEQFASYNASTGRSVEAILSVQLNAATRAIAGNPGEQELIFAPGFRFRITGVKIKGTADDVQQVLLVAESL